MAETQYSEAVHEDRFTAPGFLELLQCFANTLDVETARDDLAPGGDRTAPSGLRHWLLEHDLIGPRDRVTPDDLKTGLELRGAIRELAHTNHGEPASPEPLKVLERIGAAADLEPRFRPGRRRSSSRGRRELPARSAASLRSRSPRCRKATGAGSRSADPTTARSCSTTTRRTSRGRGARCGCAATARRFGITAGAREPELLSRVPRRSQAARASPRSRRPRRAGRSRRRRRRGTGSCASRRRVRPRCPSA